MKVIHDVGVSKITLLNDGTIMKEAKDRDIPSYFFEYYKKLREYCPALVEIYDIQGNTIYMENIKIVNHLKDYLRFDIEFAKQGLRDKDLLLKSYNAMTGIMRSCLEFSRDHLTEDEFFLFRDIHTGNFVVDENRNIRILDPDSLRLVHLESMTKQTEYYRRYSITLRNFMKILWLS